MKHFNTTYHVGFPSRGKPATSAARIPIHIKSWLTDPSAPRISVGEICRLKEIRSHHDPEIHIPYVKTIITVKIIYKGTTSDMYSGTIADAIPIPIPANERPTIIVWTLWAVALQMN